MTGFNKTLDVNLEHPGLGYTHNQSIKLQQSFRKEENTKVTVFSTYLVRCCSAFRALVFTFLDPPRFMVPFSFNDGEAEIMPMLRRRDVEAWRCWPLVDFLFSLTRRRDVGTSRHWDVGTSRHWDATTFLLAFCSSSLCTKMISKISSSTCYSHKMQESDIGL